MQQTPERRLLNVNPDTVYFLIDKAHEFQAKEGVILPEEPDNSGEDWALQGLGDHHSDPTVHEMRSTIDDLEPDQQIQLVALMWVGRGDFSVDEWDASLAQAAESRNARTADYLIGTPLLADYLEEGLSQLGLNRD